VLTSALGRRRRVKTCCRLGIGQHCVARSSPEGGVVVGRLLSMGTFGSETVEMVLVSDYRTCDSASVKLGSTHLHAAQARLPG
jgi:hypothetical protein